MNTQSRRRRLTSAIAVLAAGLAVAGAIGISGQRQSALVLTTFSVVFAVVTFVWSGRDGDVGSLLGASGDERQRSIDVRATAVAGLAMGAFSLAMAIAQLARGGDNPWVVVCAVGAAAYVGTLVTERLRS